MNAALVADYDKWNQRFGRHLQAMKRADRTVTIYTDAVRDLATFVAGHERAPTKALETTREHVVDFIIDCHSHLAMNTVNQRFRSLQQFWRWLEDEGEIELSPMHRMKPPPIEEKPVPLVPPGSFEKLVATRAGKDFEQRRDTALLWLFKDTGVRSAEMMGVTLPDMDLAQRAISVVGKGNKRRVVVYGHKTAKALDRYLRVRDDAPFAHLKWLWISRKGRFTDWGARQMIERACVTAGIEHVYPHKFRHTFAHEWQVDGGEGEDLMRLMGWRSRAMVARYGSSAAVERAHAAYRRRTAPSDR